MIKQTSFRGKNCCDGAITSVPRVQTGITCTPQVVFGVDKLKVSCWIHWRDRQLFKRLETHKKCLQDSEKQQAPFDFIKSQSKYNFVLYRTGTTKFSYRLKTGDIFLFLSPRPHTAQHHNCQIEIGSISSQEDAQGVFNEIINMLASLGGFLDKHSVQEIHLAADFIGVPIRTTHFHYENNWISQAHKFSYHSSRRKLTGITIGKGDIMFRAYDKINEMKEKQDSSKQAFFSKLWNIDITTTDVTRCEFQIRRPVLKQFDCDTDTVDDVINNLSAIWQYLTKKWCRFSISPVDRKNKNQQKAKISHHWKQLQNIAFSIVKKTAQRIRQPLLKNIDALAKQFRGIAMTIASSHGAITDNLEIIKNTAINVLKQELDFFHDADQVEFYRRMQMKFDECYNTVL